MVDLHLYRLLVSTEDGTDWLSCGPAADQHPCVAGPATPQPQPSLPAALVDGRARGKPATSWVLHGRRHRANRSREWNALPKSIRRSAPPGGSSTSTEYTSRPSLRRP